MSERLGRYVLLEALGRGSMGEVWLVRPEPPSHGFSQRAVLKRLFPELAADPSFVRRFEHEAAVAGRIDSPFVAKLFEAGQAGQTLYLVHEYVEGWTLSRVLNELRKSSEPHSIASSVQFTLELLEGLEALHSASDGRGRLLETVHRDLSPNNIMVGEDGRPKIIDLGLGKSRIQTWRTQTGAVMGSPGYMAPEQAVGRRVDQRADLYSVGVVLFELLTLQPYIERGPVAAMLLRSAQPAFRAPSTLRADVPRSLDELLRRALALSADDRFRSASDFAAALGGARTQAESSAPILSLIGPLLSSEAERTRIEVTRLAELTAVAERRDTASADPAEPEPTRIFTESRTLTELTGDQPASPRRLSSALRRPGGRLAAAAISIMLGSFALGSWAQRFLEESDAPAQVLEVAPEIEATPQDAERLEGSVAGQRPLGPQPNSNDKLGEVAQQILDRAHRASDPAEARSLLEMCAKLEVLPACADELALQTAPGRGNAKARPSSGSKGSAATRRSEATSTDVDGFRASPYSGGASDRRGEGRSALGDEPRAGPLDGESSDLGELTRRLGDLLNRTRTAKKSARDRPELANRASKLQSDISSEMGSPAASRVGELERRVRAIEAEVRR
ncbi:MAG: serine/threonine protein kinase [Deltaproteobacteria bacterium]|nr:serine/threonine protein kinase [Deltaproteobacteria bacterium]